jgi:hypothetical protein
VAHVTPEKARYQLAVHRRIEAREMHELALDAPLGAHAAQKLYLRRLAGSVEPFQYDEHCIDF